MMLRLGWLLVIFYGAWASLSRATFMRGLTFISPGIRPELSIVLDSFGWKLGDGSSISFW